MSQNNREVEQSNRKFEEVTVSSEHIFEGNIIKVQVDTVKLPDGSKATREIVKHTGAVAVLALYRDKMLVVKQYRKPLERSLVEIPAGKLDPGEEPLSAAKRELKEETGFVAGGLTHVCSFYVSPGFSNELLHLYFTDELTAGEAQPDDDEFLENSSITLEEAKQYIEDGRIRDAKTVMAVYAWERFEATGKIK